MDKGFLKDTLKKHKLRITDCRLDTLEYLSNTEHAVSSRELEENFPHYDRVTMYRTLNSFVEKGILHSIPDNSGVARYGLCDDACSPGHHIHNHIHFKCSTCGTMECLDASFNDNIDLKGYVIEDVQLVITGKCKKCA